MGVVGESAEAEKQRRVGREGEGKLGCGRGWVCLLAERARQRKKASKQQQKHLPLTTLAATCAAPFPSRSLIKTNLLISSTTAPSPSAPYSLVTSTNTFSPPTSPALPSFKTGSPTLSTQLTLRPSSFSAASHPSRKTTSPPAHMRRTNGAPGQWPGSVPSGISREGGSCSGK